MGSFINSQADNEICEALNKRFSDDVDPNDAQGRTYIAVLRDHFRNRENFFDGGHHLNRVFHRLARSVTGGTSVPRTRESRRRWFALLRRTLPAAVMRAIRDQLTAILARGGAANPAGSVNYVTFSTQHVSTRSGTFELFDQNSAAPQILTDANRKTYCAVVLQCHVDAALPDAPNEPDPPPADGGETTFAVRRRPRRGVKKAKKSAKKSSAKKKKTTAKKSKAKKAGKRNSRR
jgi:hypothetical protein